MAQRKKPRCFVAMAFDHDDTDQIYDHGIAPVLKRNGVKPIIINRKQDNRDINVQIIDELNACDFSITDLTYARPSVYFEAGYAQREVEVIYTVRSDHLKKNQPEDKRVHFDLQMKPIIKWKDPSDSTFSKRLERPLKSTFLRDWNRKTKEEEKLKRDRELFASIPVNHRLRIIRTRAINSIRALGFDDWFLTGVAGLRSVTGTRHFKNPVRYAANNAGFRTSLERGNIFTFITIVAKESITLRDLRGPSEFPYHYLTRARYIWTIDEDSLIGNEEFHEHRIVFALKNVPESRIMSAMPNFWKGEGSSQYKFVTTEPFRGFKEPEVDIRCHIYNYFPSGIDSLTKLEKEVKDIVDCIKL